MKDIKIALIAFGFALITSGLCTLLNVPDFLTGWFSCMAYYIYLLKMQYDFNI